VFSWTGCYIGGNAGYGWSKQTYSFAGAVFNEFTADGGAVGGQLGCDFQSGNWVIGLQGMWDWADLSGRRNETGFAFFDTAKIKDFGSLTGRLGYTIQPDALLYVKGGAAWANTHYFDDAIGGGAATSANVSRSGWTIGVGWEKMIAPNWSFFVEYNYANFGTARHPTFTPVIFITDIRENLQTVLVGLNYRFSTGKGPVVAKY
jgi:outer membrane immunogenic protein